MATINKRIAEEVIANHGHYPGDPQVSLVLKYTNQWGGESYAVVYPHEDQRRYHESPYCSNVEVLWSRADDNDA